VDWEHREAQDGGMWKRGGGRAAGGRDGAGGEPAVSRSNTRHLVSYEHLNYVLPQCIPFSCVCPFTHFVSNSDRYPLLARMN
jgi:hypothetical protein